MKYKLFPYPLILLIIIYTTSCQSIKTPSDIVTPSSQPVINNPTKTLSLSMVTNLPPYPGSNATSYPLQVPKSLPYPQPTFGVTLPPAPTFNLTAVPKINRLPTVTAEPSLPPLPEYTQSVRRLYPNCSPDGLYQKCSDVTLGIQFKYPSHWGYFSAELINGTCGGYSYGYHFSGSSEVSAGGTSVDYCKGIEGDLFTFFKGFKPGHGCDEFPQAQDCRQINDNVVIATYLPNFQSICNYGPGTIFTPQMFVGINISSHHIVPGIVFSVSFLSIKGTDKLLEPFGGIITDSTKCSDPKTEKAITHLVEDISLKVKQGTFDEETSYKVKGILDFANSITFTP